MMAGSKTVIDLSLCETSVAKSTFNNPLAHTTSVPNVTGTARILPTTMDMHLTRLEAGIEGGK
jgi:hypothetical protein